MSAPVLERCAAIPRWPHLFASGVCAFYVSVIAWLVLATLVGAVLLGTRPLVITSGSMDPAIRAGDIVLATPTPHDELETGTVVAFRDPSRGGALVTHRIVDVTADGYVTQGDASQAPDVTAVPRDAVVGVGRVLVPFIGLPVVWTQQGQWAVLAAWAVATLLASTVGFRRPPRPSTAPVPAQCTAATPATTPTTPRTPQPHDAPAPRATTAAAPPTVTIRLHAPARRRETAGGRTVSVLAIVSIGLLSVSAGTASAAYTARTTSNGNTFDALTLDPVPSVSASCTKMSGEITVDWTTPATPHDGFVVIRTDATGTVTELVPSPPTATQLVDSPVNQRETYRYEVVSELATWHSDPSLAATAVCEPGSGPPGGGNGGGPEPKTTTTMSPLVAPVDETSSTPTV